jgi:hypothetical protein
LCSWSPMMRTPEALRTQEARPPTPPSPSPHINECTDTVLLGATGLAELADPDSRSSGH